MDNKEALKFLKEKIGFEYLNDTLTVAQAAKLMEEYKERELHKLRVASIGINGLG